MRDFHYSTNVLVKAFMNDTLQHQNCFACAVGNLVADANGFEFTEIISIGDEKLKVWCDGKQANWFSIIAWKDFSEDACQQIASTGYSVNEVVRIERAFESALYGASEEEWMFNGLMAVVDVLADIHGIDLKVREEAKALFVKA